MQPPGPQRWVNVAGERGLWEEGETGSLERTDDGRVRWKKKKLVVISPVGSYSFYPRGSKTLIRFIVCESGAGRCENWLQDGKGSESENRAPQGV